MLRRNLSRLSSSSSSPGTAAESFAFCKSHYNAGIGRMCDLMMERGEGAYIFDKDGTKYLDLVMGIGVCNLGHVPELPKKRAEEQLSTLWHGQINTGFHVPLENLMKKMMTVLPGAKDSATGHSKFDNFLFVSTGSEAVEAAIKLSRAVSGGRPCMATLQGGYHGRTLGAASLTTSKSSYARGIKPLLPGVVVVPAPYHRQCKVPFDMSYDELSARCLAQIEDAFDQQCAASEVSMLIVEPVLGEGGYCPLPLPFWKGIRDITRKNGILLVADEIQSGAGRCGSMWMCEQHAHGDDALLPDVITFAKGIANGMPLAGLVCPGDIGFKQTPLSQGGTYAGNCIAVAAANGVLETFEKDPSIISENVPARSRQFVDGLLRMIETHHLPICEVRGRGLMLGVEFDLDRVAPGTAAKFKNECFKRKLIVPTTGKFEAVRLIPPLNITEAQVADALGIMEESLVATFSESDSKAKVSGFDTDGKLPGSDVPLRWTTRFA